MARTAIALFVFALVAHAGDPIDVPTSALKFKKGVEFTEGVRGMREAFPYIEAQGVDLTPATLARHVNGIPNGKAALEAVRLFAGGPLVRDEGTAKALLAEAEKLSKQLKHLPVKIGKHRPASYAPVAVADKETGGWSVSLVAYEMDNVLRLVHIVASVSKTGAVKIERKALFEGPMTVWQSAMLMTEDSQAQERSAKEAAEMRNEAVIARRRLAAVVKAPRTLDSAWAMARLRLSPIEIQDLWGQRNHVVGSGLLLVTYTLKDGTAVLFDATVNNKPVYRMQHVGAVKLGKMLPKPGPTLHRLSRR